MINGLVWILRAAVVLGAVVAAAALVAGTIMAATGTPGMWASVAAVAGGLIGLGSVAVLLQISDLLTEIRDMLHEQGEQREARRG